MGGGSALVSASNKAIASNKSTRTPSKSTATSTKSTTTASVIKIRPPVPQNQNQTSSPPTIFTKIVFNESIKENDSFCHPNCAGTFAGVVVGSLLVAVLVILAFIETTRIYNRRRQSKPAADGSTLNGRRNDDDSIRQSSSDMMTPTTTSGVDNNYHESNPTNDGHVSIITISRNTGTLLPSQTNHLRRALDSNSIDVEPKRISDHVYAVMGPIAKQQNQNQTQMNPLRIYLELIGDESDDFPSQPPRVEEEYVQHNNVGLDGSSLVNLNNIEYEIIDCRVQSTSSPNRLNALRKGSGESQKTSKGIDV